MIVSKVQDWRMALAELWKSAHIEIQDKHVQQVIGFAGDGKLRDGCLASKEFREFLSIVPSNFLSRYANDCLVDKFDSSGLALQDVINEVGVRLGFHVEKGRYRGVTGEPGFDGLWTSDDGNAIIVEVKTTDAYRIDLGTVAAYRSRVVASGKATVENSSILIIVGRNDTGDLEAQVRGSRHAWDIRLISIDGLLRLMRLKESLDDPAIMQKIRRVLTPQEFTKVDGIIDLVFSTAQDVNKDEDESQVPEGEIEDQKKPKFTPVNFRDACAEAVQHRLGTPLVKQSYAVYSSPDTKLTVVCIISREYKKPKNSGFWFAFHPHQRDLVLNDEQSYVALGCGSEKFILLIPGPKFASWLDRFHVTELDGRFYWHVRVDKDKDGFLMRVRKGADTIQLNEYLIKTEKI